MGAVLASATAFALMAQAGMPPSKEPTRLFSDDQPIRATIRGPIGATIATPAPARTKRSAVLTLAAPAAEQHSILISPRGLSRRQRETCRFPPLRVEFPTKVPNTALFERQRGLKLVTHCRSSPGHQHYVLLEFAAYRLFNALSPAALRVRLGMFDYVEESGRANSSRLGFFIEDPDDAASRNGLKEVRTTARVAASQLNPAAAARAALFQYMIGNSDWSMRAGPAGDSCCHNFKLMGAAATARHGLVPVPYDFDASGFVNPPYAVPPDTLGLSSVRERRYRGYCAHNAQALDAAREFRAKRAELLAILAAIPQLDERRRRGAEAYLDSFFRDIATDGEVTKRVLRTCIN